MISDDHHLDEARTPGRGDGKVDAQRIQVGNQADQGRRGCWVRMCVVLASVEIDGGLYSLASLGVLKVGLMNVVLKDQDIGAGSVRYPCLSDYVALDERSLPDCLLGMCPAERPHDILDPLDGKLRNPITYSLDFQLVPDLD
jgi:hypothetical protein